MRVAHKPIYDSRLLRSVTRDHVLERFRAQGFDTSRATAVYVLADHGDCLQRQYGIAIDGRLAFHATPINRKGGPIKFRPYDPHAFISYEIER